MTTLPTIPRQLPIFDQVLPDDDLLPLPRRILTMHLTNGRNDAVNCGTCDHLLHNRSNGRTYYKCARYALSAADAADWRDYWPACGLWEQEANKNE